MKKKEIKELHTKSKTELSQAIDKLEQELVKLHVDKGAGRLKNFNLLAEKKRHLARLKTVSGEKDEKN